MSSRTLGPLRWRSSASSLRRQTSGGRRRRFRTNSQLPSCARKSSDGRSCCSWRSRIRPWGRTKSRSSTRMNQSSRGRKQTKPEATTATKATTEGSRPMGGTSITLTRCLHRTGGGASPCPSFQARGSRPCLTGPSPPRPPPQGLRRTTGSSTRPWPKGAGTRTACTSTPASTPRSSWRASASTRTLWCGSAPGRSTATSTCLRASAGTMCARGPLATAGSCPPSRCWPRTGRRSCRRSSATPTTPTEGCMGSNSTKTASGVR
mmetsp:Transcript_67619/g.119928  ORF Transcript_67619/g.119928 Transcript_67619/m.119928 type:complete len:263 (+) Transcript_67619:2187-2975(+)